MDYITLQTEDSGFDILEKSTDTTISINASEKYAKELCARMNIGSGFNGWTPTFFASFKGLQTD